METTAIKTCGPSRADSLFCRSLSNASLLLLFLGPVAPEIGQSCVDVRNCSSDKLSCKLASMIHLLPLYPHLFFSRRNFSTEFLDRSRFFLSMRLTAKSCFTYSPGSKFASRNVVLSLDPNIPQLSFYAPERRYLVEEAIQTIFVASDLDHCGKSIWQVGVLYNIPYG